ncbi:hypothetical protein F5X68DRAFT_176009 [Plectosphaerella plurivora]|uniref:Heparan-alpha-glucosaminide N-acetyltransferase catalytic domain-containing protein n=1 Tax=Plectosphaerella plurivora TaxID=936078 RepID=A0A9P8V3Y3_9PEZI|nr:hypothetical protein F5X68DRAFT_176009 [Plectosphaerella plurivora]
MADQPADGAPAAAVSQETDFRPLNGTATPPPRSPSPTPRTSRHLAPIPQNARILAPDLLRGLLMALMALDHNAMSLGSWPHGTNGDTEGDSMPVTHWNRPVAYIIRTLTHLCAPGFTLLLGLGVVYFGRSRAALGWSSARMARHFAVRAAVLTLVSIVFGLVMTAGQVWFFNIILVALAVDYLLVGLLWLAISSTEPVLAEVLTPWMPDYVAPENDETTPLLREHNGHIHIATSQVPSRRAASVAWNLHNLALLVLAGVTTWWNIWMSPTGGHCVPGGPPEPHGGLFWRFWFYNVQKMDFPGVVSVFPPLAWLSFAILGLLYGRLVIARDGGKPTTSLATANIVVGIFFAILFVATRLLHFGNLSEDCLQVADVANVDNPYLASPQAFFYVTKYPPDVAFSAYTLAVNFLLMGIFTSIPAAWAANYLKPLIVYGTSALFFYIAHILLLFAVGLPLVMLFGHELDHDDPWGGKPAIGIDSIWGFFGVWLFVMVVLYFLCQRYSAFKRTKGPDSIWRFF